MRPTHPVVALAAGIALAAGAATPAGAEPAQAAPAALSPASSAQTAQHTVTLVTGDVIDVQSYADGRQVASARPDAHGRRATTNYRLTEEHGDLYVTPASATALVAAGRLDRELFNVTGLIEAGYDNAHRASLPLIVTTTTPRTAGVAGRTAAAKAAAAALPAAHDTRVLPSIGATALTRDNADADAFWAGLLTATATAAPSARSTGLGKVWLDRPVRSTLDRSVPQIGAPQTWADGYDGSGVKVAVLDTGIDPKHPDVAGRIAETANFSDDSDAVDHNGHGTHVAATIAGSGAAAQGTRKGVAPGASLYVGKVLNGSGQGSMSWIVAGMEWAAAQGVDVINMSLGSDTPTDGTDPISQALNALTESSGALFVVAAGNAGPGESTVSSPGTADAALTVGAVDRSDRVAEFSGRGPRFGDGAIKPEITAPGVGIVAARAAGTSLGTPVDDNYTTLSGTSMATPHVAGAAAILAQRHPEWTPAQLKDGLVSSAQPSNEPVAAVGAGRVDVARAVRQSVSANPSTVTLPASTVEDTPATSAVELSNSSDTAATVDLALDMKDAAGNPAPAGLFGLESTSVEVPAGGTATVRLVVDASKGRVGDFTGRLTGTGSGADLRVTVPITKRITPVMYPVSISAIGRDGRPARGDSGVDILDLDTGQTYNTSPQGADPSVVQLPAGRYSVMGLLFDDSPPGTQSPALTLTGHTDVRIDGPQSISVDARKAVRIDVQAPVTTRHERFLLGYYRQGVTPTSEQTSSWLVSPVTDAYAVPMGRAMVGTFEMYHHWDLIAPKAAARLLPDNRSVRLDAFEGTTLFDGRRDLPVVDIGTKTDVTGTDLTGKLAFLTYSSADTLYAQLEAVAAAHAAAVVVANSEPGYLWFFSAEVGIPEFSTSQEDGAAIRAALRRGTTRMRLDGTAQSPYWYDVARWEDHVPSTLNYDVGPANMARIDSSFHSTADVLGYGNVATFRPWMYSTMVATRVNQGDVQRQDWVSTGDGVTVGASYNRANWDGGWLYNGQRHYRAGQQITEHWFAPGGPSAPRYPGFYGEFGLPAYREGDTVLATLPEFGDSDPDHFGFAEGLDQTEVRLYQDGTLIGSGTGLRNTQIALPADTASYRLEQDVTRTAEWWSTASTTSTAWTFRSGRPAAGREVLPLLHVDYDLGVDLHNSWRANQPNHVTLTVRQPVGATASRVEGATVQVSFDDGATWQPARAQSRGKGEYRVTIDHPRQAHSVSLRVQAWDAAGNRVEQTVRGAYTLR